jgi:pimeloyl-ACP methyl ester carboxylesterase
MVDEALAEGTLAVVAQSAHAVMIENPEGFNRAVADFVLGEG